MILIRNLYGDGDVQKRTVCVLFEIPTYVIPACNAGESGRIVITRKQHKCCGNRQEAEKPKRQTLETGISKYSA